MNCFLGLKGLNKRFLKFIQAEIRCSKKIKINIWNTCAEKAYLLTQSISKNFEIHF